MLFSLLGFFYCFSLPMREKRNANNTTAHARPAFTAPIERGVKPTSEGRRLHTNWPPVRIELSGPVCVKGVVVCYPQAVECHSHASGVIELLKVATCVGKFSTSQFSRHFSPQFRHARPLPIAGLAICQLGSCYFRHGMQTATGRAGVCVQLGGKSAYTHEV